MKELTKLLLCISIFYSISLNAQLLNPFVKNYSINDYGADNQNWGIDINENGIVFVANNKGLLTYNGQKWNLLQLPNKTIVRSVLATNNKIFTGSYEEFGYWESDTFGKYTYTSLIPLISEKYEFKNEDIWQIIRFNNSFVFRSYSTIYIYDGKTVEIIKDSDNILDILDFDGKLLANSLLKGLLVLSNGKFQPHPLSKSYKSIENIVYDKGQLFIKDKEEGIVIIASETGVKTVVSEALNNVLEQSILNKVSFISNTKLLLGTIKKGVIIYQIKEKKIEIIDRESGLQNNTVLGQKIKDEFIWLSLDNGISRIPLENFVGFYKDFSGTVGAVYDLAYFNNTLYLASNTGLYRFIDNELELVENTEGHIWNLHTYDNNLFCASNSGIKIYTDKKQVYSESKMGGVYKIQPIPNTKNMYLQGTYIGLSLLKKLDENKWESKVFNNISFSIDNIEFESDSIVWLTHPYKGVYRAKLNKNLDIENIQSFGENPNFKEYKTKIYKIDDKILFYNSKNWFEFSNEKTKIIPFEPFQHLINKDFKRQDDNGGYWFIDENKVLLYLDENLREINSLNSTQIKERLITGFEKVIVYNDSTKLLNLNDGFAQFNSKILRKSQKRFALPSIELLYTNETTYDITEGKIEIPFKEAGNLTIEVYSKNKYENTIRYKIKGKINYERNARNGRIELQNLSYGTYTLFLYNKGSIAENDEKFIKIVVLRPWYLTYWMFLVYLLFVVLIFLVTRKIGKRKILNEQSKIHKKLIENTQKRIDILEKDKLKNEVENKKKILVTITESIIKKNEIIIILKNELTRLAKTFPDQLISKKLLKVANESINNNKDWEVFEGSFNDLHADFLKKIVNEFPKLTSKNLKLCAYIKTGHTSKDIAPLLGISVRGVEIQRYRLRKKINLSKEQSIFDFLINF